MKWFITFIIGVILKVLEWFVKKIGISKTIILIELSVFVVFQAFFLGAITFISFYILHIWILFRQVLTDFSTFNSVSGSAYGISLQTILSNFWGFMEVSGLKTAIIMSLDLFAGLLSLYLTVQLYKLYVFAINKVTVLINDLLKLMTR